LANRANNHRLFIFSWPQVFIGIKKGANLYKFVFLFIVAHLGIMLLKFGNLYLNYTYSINYNLKYKKKTLKGTLENDLSFKKRSWLFFMKLSIHPSIPSSIHLRRWKRRTTTNNNNNNNNSSRASNHVVEPEIQHPMWCSCSFGILA
jgi:hypothetical protein